ncbi:transglycosylase SLT domain-containing protein [Legionella spiritensis]|uniref:Transcriptional regulator n=1 Tax=Legionella spiritensis TaxID=452 RepID=A0A0W0Z586_LEGSP|nr:transglycosylase SLT domain-containing protein [Legionella spiritensis]KTD63955.1 transcriptional regulator [Legionella spiritensis]SNV36818.1 transcriptional regulator [Legionella spiritensis]VEG89990.1 transcriptional regulator [Legionella spiritensis]
MNKKLLILAVLSLLITGCVKPPPANVDNICNIFKQYPKWRHYAQDVERRWKVPVSVQMAIIHQESKFNGRAKPARTKLLWIIPWKRPSSAYGYSQALHTTWKQYKRSSGGLWASRDDFSDAVDFIGWYANQANRRAKIPRDDAYSLYLAYHEGIGGYQRKTYLKKTWLVHVARKVKARAQTYQAQLGRCKRPSRWWF